MFINLFENINGIEVSSAEFIAGKEKAGALLNQLITQMQLGEEATWPTELFNQADYNHKLGFVAGLGIFLQDNELAGLTPGLKRQLQLKLQELFHFTKASFENNHQFNLNLPLNALLELVNGLHLPVQYRQEERELSSLFARPPSFYRQGREECTECALTGRLNGLGIKKTYRLKAAINTEKIDLNLLKRLEDLCSGSEDGSGEEESNKLSF